MVLIVKGLQLYLIMKSLLCILLFCALDISCLAQDGIRYRIIFIGDAGEMNREQRKSLEQAANHIIPGKTSTIFLGDNIYPDGMGLPGEDNEEETQLILKSQFTPMRAKGAATYFVPGNHDWDRSGKKGLEKIRREGQFLSEQNDPLLKLIPANGCPDPVEVNFGDSLTVIAFDSEWWLFPYTKADEKSDCSCKTKEDVLARMQEIKEKNKGKFIFLASHHPFQSYGSHGGKFSWKDHVFPLTELKGFLYIPLPVIGSLYPLVRKMIKNPEDLKNKKYQELIKRVENVFDQTPNVVYVAGHEHGLQLIKSKHLQIVSGAGAKRSFAKKGRYSLFSDSTQGFVTVDLLSGGSLRIGYHIDKKGSVKEAFNYSLSNSSN